MWILVTAKSVEHICCLSQALIRCVSKIICGFSAQDPGGQIGSARVHVLPILEEFGAPLKVSKDRIRQNIEQGFSRRDDVVLEALFNRHKNEDSDCLSEILLLDALREINSPLNAADAVKAALENLGHREGEPLDLDKFKALVDYPTPLERFLQTLPLSRLLADALLDGSSSSEPLYWIAALTAEDVDVVADEFRDGLKRLLLQHCEKCRLAAERERTLCSSNSSLIKADNKFLLRPLSCGRVEDFHEGLSGRIGTSPQSQASACFCAFFVQRCSLHCRCFLFAWTCSLRIAAYDRTPDF